MEAVVERWCNIMDHLLQINLAQSQFLFPAGTRGQQQSKKLMVSKISLGSQDFAGISGFHEISISYRFKKLIQIPNWIPIGYC